MTVSDAQQYQMGSIGERYSGRSNHFDLLRLTLAMLVILSHSFVLSTGKTMSEPLYARLGSWHTIGSSAVSLFFFISGFLITQSWLRDPMFVSYWRRRALRILPAYAVAAAVCIFVLAPLVSDNWTMRPLVIQALKIQTWTSPAAFTRNPFPRAINGAVWTIRYELWCYMVVALFGLLRLLRGPVVLGLMLASGSVVVAQCHRSSFVPDVRLGPLGELALWPWLLFAFSAGMAAYIYRDRIPYSAGAAGVAVIALAAAVWLRSSTAWGVGLPVLGGYSVLVIAFTKDVPLPSLSSVGDFSYGAYLYGFPVQQALVRVHTGGGAFGLFVSASVATIFIAALSWYAVERPALSLKRGRARKAPTPERAIALIAS